MLDVVPMGSFSVDPLTPTIFHEPWWLEIATQGRSDVVEVVENGVTVGRMPYLLTKKMGRTSVNMPPLTYFLGPAVIEGEGKPNSRFLRRMDITLELIRQLPAASSTYIKCHRGVTDVIPFQTAGFRSLVQFTHEIHPQTEDIIWKNLRDKARNLIRSSRGKVIVVLGDDPKTFMRFYRDSFENRGIKNNKNVVVCERLIQASLDRKRGHIYEARNKDGDIEAAIFCAWDRAVNYFLMCGRDPRAPVGAINLLVWQAIVDTAKEGRIFDFGGISAEGFARFSNQYTASVVPRYIAVRESVPLRIARAVLALTFHPASNYFSG